MCVQDSKASKALKMQQIHAEKLIVAGDLQRSEVIKQRLLKQTSDLKVSLELFTICLK